MMVDSTWSAVPANGPLMRPDEAAAYLSVSRPTYERMAADGIVPAPKRFGSGGRASFVPKGWLDAAIAANFQPDIAA